MTFATLWYVYFLFQMKWEYANSAFIPRTIIRIAMRVKLSTYSSIGDGPLFFMGRRSRIFRVCIPKVFLGGSCI